MVALVREDAVVDFNAHVEVDYLRRTGIQPRVYAVSAAAGAGLVA
jgi:galactokinase